MTRDPNKTNGPIRSLIIQCLNQSGLLLFNSNFMDMKSITSELKMMSRVNHVYSELCLW